MKYLLFVSLCSLLFACGNSNQIVENTDAMNENQNKPPKEIHVNSEVGEFMASDPLTIRDVTVKGHFLHIGVQYSGGCQEHSFKFLGSPAIMKSYPPKRSVQLYHNNNSDQCKGYITTKIIVDLKEMADSKTPGSKISLLLDGWKEPINYEYIKE